jgi:hypothetical protein
MRQEKIAKEEFTLDEMEHALARADILRGAVI